MMIMLKPCPFCGNPEVEMVESFHDWEQGKVNSIDKYYEVCCEGCELKGPPSFSGETAEQKWNSRSTEDWNKIQSEIAIKLGQEK